MSPASTSTVEAAQQPGKQGLHARSSSSEREKSKRQKLEGAGNGSGGGRGRHAGFSRVGMLLGQRH